MNRLNTPSSASRGQLSVEFFLIVSFSLLLAVFLLAQSETNLAENSRLSRAAIAKSALDSVVSDIDAVSVQGAGARLSASFYVPRDAFCFVVNASSKTVSCELGLNTTVRSYPYAAPRAPSFAAECYPTNSTAFWVSAVVENVNGTVRVNCTKVY